MATQNVEAQETEYRKPETVGKETARRKQNVTQRSRQRQDVPFHIE